MALNAAPKLKLVEKENSALWPRQKCWWSSCRGRLGEGGPRNWERQTFPQQSVQRHNGYLCLRISPPSVKQQSLQPCPLHELPRSHYYYYYYYYIVVWCVAVLLGTLWRTKTFVDDQIDIYDCRVRSWWVALELRSHMQLNNSLIYTFKLVWFPITAVRKLALDSQSLLWSSIRISCKYGFIFSGASFWCRDETTVQIPRGEWRHVRNCVLRGWSACPLAHAADDRVMEPLVHAIRCYVELTLMVTTAT